MPSSGDNQYLEGYTPETYREVRPEPPCPTETSVPRLSGTLYGNQYVLGYVQGVKVRDIIQEICVVISNPILVERILRPRGVQVIQSLRPAATSSDGDYASDDQIYRVPIPGTYFVVALNGRVMQPAETAADLATAGCYFAAPSGSFRPQGEVELGDKLRWIGSNAGVEVEADDELIVIYEVQDALPQGTKYMQAMAAVATSADGDPMSSDTISQAPVPGTAVVLALNGRVIVPADGPGEVAVSAFYIASPTGDVRAHGQAQLGDVLRWNGSVAGTEIVASDEIILIYET